MLFPKGFDFWLKGSISDKRHLSNQESTDIEPPGALYYLILRREFRRSNIEDSPMKHEILTNY